jgi:hypothetical protein
MEGVAMIEHLREFAEAVAGVEPPLHVRTDFVPEGIKIRVIWVGDQGPVLWADRIVSWVEVDSGRINVLRAALALVVADVERKARGDRGAA